MNTEGTTAYLSHPSIHPSTRLRFVVSFPFLTCHCCRLYYTSFFFSVFELSHRLAWFGLVGMTCGMGWLAGFWGLGWIEPNQLLLIGTLVQLLRGCGGTS